MISHGFVLSCRGRKEKREKQSEKIVHVLAAQTPIFPIRVQSIVHKAFGSHNACSDADAAAGLASAAPVGVAERVAPLLTPSRFDCAPEFSRSTTRTR